MAKFGLAGLAFVLVFAPEVAMAQMTPSDAVGAPMIPSEPMGGRGVRYDAPRPMPRSADVRPMTAAPMTAVPMAGSPMAAAPMNTQSRGPAAGRWSNVPGGWQAYRHPSYGYTLPKYWVSAPFYVQDHSMFGLPRPGEGFGWSRYYDDAVLTDSYGRIYESRQNVDWSRDPRFREDYSDSYGYRDDGFREDGYRDDGYRGERRGDGGTAGTVIGGVVGGVAGSAIAGRGSRIVGGLIGGTVGAIAGNAIGKASDRRGSRDGYRNDTYQGGGYRYEGRAPRRGPSGEYSYDGRWTGSWDGGPVRTYEGRFDGNVQTHWSQGGNAGYDVQHGGYDAGSYGYGQSYGYSYGGGGTTVTTTVIEASAPIVTRSVSYVTDYVRVAAPRRAVKRVWRAKPRCICVVR